MIKNTLPLLILILLPFTCIAGGGYANHIGQGYDPTTGYFYYPVKKMDSSTGIFSTNARSKITNIMIFDPRSETHSMLFKSEQALEIEVFTFEQFQDEHNQVRLFGYNARAFNNFFDGKKEMQNRLLVVTRSKESALRTLWLAQKDGSNLMSVHTFDESVDWHIDLKNKKVRFIFQHKGISIKSIDW